MSRKAIRMSDSERVMLSNRGYRHPSYPTNTADILSKSIRPSKDMPEGELKRLMSAVERLKK